MTASTELAALDRGRYLRLTTWKRDGTPVPTPVWFVVDGDTILVWTDAPSGKVKRLRNRPDVEVALCDARGRPKGKARAGTARVVSDPEVMRRAHDVLNRKYVVKRGYDIGMKAIRAVRRRPEGATVVVEITLTST
jgi:PPOX class probable F420-dependent enzyme